MFPLSAPRAISGDIFVHQDSGWAGKDVAQHPTILRTAPMTGNCLAVDVVRGKTDALPKAVLPSCTSSPALPDHPPLISSGEYSHLSQDSSRKNPQETQVRALAWEDPTCRGTTKPFTPTAEPVLSSPGAASLEAHTP